MILSYKALRAYIFRKYRGISNYFRPGVSFKSERYKKLEARVPKFELPNPLLTETGSIITNKESWSSGQRVKILNYYQRYIYGNSPFSFLKIGFSILSGDSYCLNGKALKKEVNIFNENKPGAYFRLLIIMPASTIEAGLKAPVFLGLNFFGNQTITREKDISVTESWLPNNSITLGRKAESLRGIQLSSWPIRQIIDAGYALATAYCGDIVPDKSDGIDLSIEHWFSKEERHNFELGALGAIDGWAWGLRKAMDYIEQDEDLDASRVVVLGHSRLGKAALWAGAQDPRFAIIISNESGCGGATLFRRRFGETIASINQQYPHWFCQEFKKFNNRENELLVDQHELIGLIAPRPVYIASAQRDLEADPYGEFLAAKNASTIYKLFGLIGLQAEELPPVNTSIMGNIGYHIRSGCHGIKRFDWIQFIRFADKTFAQSSNNLHSV